MTTEPDMTNKLGVLRRDNVLKLFKHHRDAVVSLAQMGASADLSSQTMRNCFGPIMRTAPSEKTMEKLCALFQVTEGKMDRTDFDPVTDSLYEDESAPVKTKKVAAVPLPPVIVPQTRIVMQIGKTNIETSVDAEIAERVLKLIILGDDI